jgi:hypothetical protein
MTLLDRYLKGEAMGQEAFDPAIFPQIDGVLNETFKRVASNVNIIHTQLKKIHYQFVSNIQYEWQRPLNPPHPDTDQLLSRLRINAEPGGHIPLSLQYFYKIVGSCNFCWDWETHPDIPWEGADPLDIPPINNLFELNEGQYDDSILISADYLQKDNISGSCYYLELTREPAIDSLLIQWNVSFIDYLRLTLNNCGFTMADQCDYDNLKAYCNYVRPLLQKI